MAAWQPPQYDPRNHQQRIAPQPQWPPQPPPQSQVQPWQPQPYGQPYPPPAVAPKSPSTGLLLGLFFPGVGCMYAERTGIGVLILVLWLLSVPLVFFLFIGVFTGFALWVLSALLGFFMTREWNAQRGIVS